MSEVPQDSGPGGATSMTPSQILAARVRANANVAAGTPGGQNPGTDDSTNVSGSHLSSPSSHSESRGQQRPRSEFEDDNDSEEHGPSTPTPQLASGRSVLLTSLALLAPSLKRARRLGIQSEADLDIFLAASPAEKTAHQYALSLSNHEALNTLSLHLEYKIPATLKVTCSDYAWAYMLSPSITSYRHGDAADNVLAVMRDLNVSDLPPQHETGRCEKLLQTIGKAMTACRHHMKDKITETLDPKKDVARDIGSLSAAIVSRSKIKLTAALYVRVAIIRWVAESFPESRKDDNFWVKVDSSMAETRRELKSSALIQAAFMELYEDDKKKYGTPDLLISQPIEYRNQEQWIQLLSDRASRPLLQSAGTSGMATKQATRRRAAAPK